MKQLEQWLKENNVGKVFRNVQLKKYTTYRVGGICRYMIFPNNTKELIRLLKVLKEYQIKYKILGNGSNTLFSDDVYEGVIIKLDAFNQLEIKDTTIRVGSGYNLMKLALLVSKKGLSGLEFATGIPGTIGGAVYMNAGAYKSDMGYVVKKIKVLTDEFQVITLRNSELDFHYRSSFLQKNKNYICLEATIKLKKGKKEEILELIKERKLRRMESQPLEYPSAGSVFRNKEGYPASGKLIEDLGLKGYHINGAEVSQKHANFIINKENATAKDIKDLIEYVKEKVKDTYQIELKVEQEFVNFETDGKTK